MNAKADAQPLFERELARWKLFARAFNSDDARGDKSVEILAQMIQGKEKPFAIDIGYMIRVNDTLLGLLLAWLAIGQFQLIMRRGRSGERIKNLQIQYWFGPSAKGDRLVDLSQTHRYRLG